MIVVIHREKTNTPQPRVTRTLLGCGAVGAVLFVLIFLLDGATRPGYDPVYHPVSALSLGNRGWIQIANFVLTGLLMVAFAVGLRRALYPGRGALWGPLLFGAFGLSLVCSGIFVMDPMQEYTPGAPAGIPQDVSWHHIVHDVFGIIVFLSLPIACFVFARRFAAKPARLGWTAYSLITGLALLMLLVAFGTAWENDSPVGGLIQRAMLIVGLGWVALVAVYLMAEYRKRTGG